LARLSAAGGHGIVTDRVGAPLVVLDGAGEVRAQVVTDGRGRAQIDGEAALCPWRFAGQYRDKETGLHYNRHRYYDADAGQYISRDPLGLRAGLRVYGYVADAGVQSDPLGLSPKAGDGCGGGRLPQDAAAAPTPPAPLPASRPIGKSADQNAAKDAAVAAAEAMGATDIRVNQQQVNALGERVGINRPDLQYTDSDGGRVYVEYDRRASRRGQPHEARILSNDPDGTVVLVEMD